MQAVVALVVVLPLLVAAAIAAFAGALRRGVVEAVGVTTAAAATGMCVALFVVSTRHPIVVWFGGWRPAYGIALGIGFAVDPIGAGMACLVGGLTTAALVFSVPLFADTAEHHYDILVLVFMAAMMAFSLTGDLFDLFVFFELMSVAAYALTGYRITEPGPLQGAINFGVINSLGSFSILFGIALVYARTGALNFAQIGAALARHPSDGLVVLAFAMLAAGLLTKAAVVPFHFWLADAHAVAPSTVCVLFSGAMVELGLYGLARVYWTMFSGPFGPHEVALGHVLVGFGATTALTGAFFCFVQQHLKRLLAFSTVAHVGLFMIGLGLLDRVGLAGVAIYVVGHGLAKGSLFLGSGILVYRLASIDEEWLRGRGRALKVTGALFALGGLAVAELPPFATFTGKALIEDAASKAGDHWAPWLFAVVAAVTGGAILRAAGRIFLGLGPRERARFASEWMGEDERPEEERHGQPTTPLMLIVPMGLLLAGALALGLVPGLSARVERAAGRFVDRPAYASTVLVGRLRPIPEEPSEPPSASSVATGAASAAGAVAIAAVALQRRRWVPARLRRRATAALGRPVLAVRSLQSGHAGDYAAWFALGLASLGGLLALATR